MIMYYFREFYSTASPTIVIYELNLSSETIPAVPYVRSLGVYLDAGLSFEHSIAHLRQLCFMYHSWIKKICHLLTKDAAKVYVHALIISRLDNCNRLFTGLPNCYMYNLQQNMHYAACVILGTLVACSRMM